MIVAVGLVVPGEQVEVEIADLGQFAPQSRVPLEVQFADADGTCWYRDDRSRLYRRTTII
ncbi:hypothetical protein OG871_01295 [Kitasatospora sp. NBC_00374]|uniref:hypothetical protein n=1 Tax=Kitasatospora sp. NBC_00374 TaxID=2975964 RepID=UPI00324DC832